MVIGTELLEGLGTNVISSKVIEKWIKEAHVAVGVEADSVEAGLLPKMAEGP